jgi:hypothetical protein
MDGAVTPALLAIFVATGTALLGGSVSVLVAIRSGNGAAAKRDPAVSILFGIAFSVTCFDLIAAALVAIRGVAYVEALEVALLLTAAFAAVGVVCGLMRGLRSGRTIKTQSV